MRTLALIIIVAAGACAGSGGTQRTTSPPPDNDAKTADVDARRILLGDGVPQDQDRAIGMFVSACKAGNRRACKTVVDLPRAADLMSSEEFEGLALKLWGWCQAGDAWSCAALHLGPERGEYVNLPSLTLEQLSDACSKGNRFACADAAMRMDLTDPRKREDQLKACRLGDTFSCEQLGKEWPRDEYLSARRRSCESGIAVDCWNVPGVERRRDELLIKECQALNLSACLYAHLIPNRVALDLSGKLVCSLIPSRCARYPMLPSLVSEPTMAGHMYEQSCELGVVTPNASTDSPLEEAGRALACVEAAKFYAQPPPGYRADKARSEVLLQRACGLDSRGLLRDDVRGLDSFCAAHK